MMIPLGGMILSLTEGYAVWLKNGKEASSWFNHRFSEQRKNVAPPQHIREVDFETRKD